MSARVLKGQSYTTSTVHLARTVSNPRAPGGVSLAQACGMRRRGKAQAYFLAPVDSDTPVTCGRCLATEKGDKA